MESVKYLAFVLYEESSDLNDFLKQVEAEFGNIDFRGTPIPFDLTNYYEKEMGANLMRRLVGFESLEDASQVSDWKLRAIEFEKKFNYEQDGDDHSIKQGRRFNLDVGYLDADKVVLPSCKRGPWKIYAHHGIWLDMVFHYSKGIFSPTDWTFQDFKTGVYQKDLMLLRESYKKALHKL